ncbi:MAG: hypothetical protein ACJ8G3_02010 [Burkholderiaceae bacterium]
MKHDDECHAILGWHRIKETVQRFDPARRSTDADDKERELAGRVIRSNRESLLNAAVIFIHSDKA